MSPAATPGEPDRRRISAALAIVLAAAWRYSGSTIRRHHVDLTLYEPTMWQQDYEVGDLRTAAGLVWLHRLPVD